MGAGRYAKAAAMGASATMMRAIAAFLAFSILASTATADEPAKPETRSYCVESANGARPNEPIDARQVRLETALRLTKAERVVNARRKR